MDSTTDVPTYAHLNRAQKRIFIIRDTLRILDPRHLDTFLSDVADPEPPNYRLVGTNIQPPLAEITVKDDAAEIDLGNVRFHEADDNTIIRRVHLYIEDEHCEMRESEAMPEVEADLDSVPIDVYLIKSTVGLFQEKFEAVKKRCRQLNKVRECAYAAVVEMKGGPQTLGHGKVC